MSQKRSKQQWGAGKESSTSLDSLLSDFEHSFETMTKSASDALTQSGSGLYQSVTLSKLQQSGAGSRSIFAMPTVSESFENMLNNENRESVGDIGIGDMDELISPRSSQILPQHNSSSASVLSSSVNVEDSNSNIEAILEKYSDRLASMVSAKVLSVSSQQKESTGSS